MRDPGASTRQVRTAGPLMCSDHHKTASAITSYQRLPYPVPLPPLSAQHPPILSPPQKPPTHTIMTPHVANPGFGTRPHLNFHTSAASMTLLTNTQSEESFRSEPNENMQITWRLKDIKMHLNWCFLAATCMKHSQRPIAIAFSSLSPTGVFFTAGWVYRSVLRVADEMGQI